MKASRKSLEIAIREALHAPGGSQIDDVLAVIDECSCSDPLEKGDGPRRANPFRVEELQEPFEEASLRVTKILDEMATVLEGVVREHFEDPAV